MLFHRFLAVGFSSTVDRVRHAAGTRSCGASALNLTTFDRGDPTIRESPRDETTDYGSFFFVLFACVECPIVRVTVDGKVRDGRSVTIVIGDTVSDARMYADCGRSGRSIHPRARFTRVQRRRSSRDARAGCRRSVPNLGKRKTSLELSPRRHMARSYVTSLHHA